MSRTEKLALKLAVFAAGALLMALEVSAFRIIGKTFGSALRETTTVIAVFLAAMSAGYWAGGRAGDRWPRAATLVATLLIAAATLLTVPWIDAWLSPRIAESGLALASHAFIASTFLFALPTFLLAATSPIAVRLFTTSTGESGSTAGSISAISTAGSIAGSLATAFFLIDWLESINRTVIFVAIAASATAVLVILATMMRVATLRRLGVATLAAALLLMLTAAFVGSSSLDRSLLRPLPGTRILFVADSPYHHVMVRDRGPARELSFNISPQTRMLLRDPNGPGLAYTDSPMMLPLMRPHARRILIIGLGGGTVTKHFDRFYPDMTVDVVELDPLVVHVAKRYFALRPSNRVRIHVMDGRMFIKRSRETWDYVFIDATTTNRYGETIPPHLTTREFFAELAAHLNDGAIVQYHLPRWSTKLYPALHKTMSSVYSSVAVTNGEILASDVPMITARETLAARAQASPAAHLPNLQQYIAAVSTEPIPAGDVPLLTDDYAPVDTLFRRPR